MNGSNGESLNGIGDSEAMEGGHRQLICFPEIANRRIE
jgi:hypothetical protein